jgi:DnaJ-class molecular chaperone
MADQQDLYEVLGVPSTATGAELDHAFRGLTRRLHPDSADDNADSDAFQRVLGAYAVLRDPVARGNYDRHRAVTVRTAGKPLVRVGPTHR